MPVPKTTLAPVIPIKTTKGVALEDEEPDAAAPQVKRAAGLPPTRIIGLGRGGTCQGMTVPSETLTAKNAGRMVKGLPTVEEDGGLEDAEV